MPIIFDGGDITHYGSDAIVNAANRELMMGGGVCGAIFLAAGPVELQSACSALGPIETGSAVVTPGFALPAKYIVHTAGPVWQGGRLGEARQLSSCYRNSLRVAAAQGCQSIAFPLISAGIYGYPPSLALRVAVAACREAPENARMRITLVVRDPSATLQQPPKARRARPDAPEQEQAPTPPDGSTREATDGETFSHFVRRHMEAKGIASSRLCGLANVGCDLLDRCLEEPGAAVPRGVALALCIGLGLTLAETEELLALAGHGLSQTSKVDSFVRLRIESGQCDVLEINEMLFRQGLAQLGDTGQEV